MEAALSAVRALHFGAVIVLFGQFAFAAFVSPGGRPPARFLPVAATSLALAVLTGCAWLAIESVNMSGLAPLEALRPPTLETVLLRTQFGHVWLARAVLAAILCAVLLAARGTAGEGRRATVVAFGGAVALMLLASLAGAGHAAADAGADRYLHAAADALHLVAAGAWLGALVPFTALIARSAREASPAALDLARAASQRFSVLGVVAVGTLALTGIVNTCYMVHGVAAFFTSRYGLELLAKLVVVALVVALAADNRLRLTGRLDATRRRDAARAARSLFRNACLEVALGFAIVAIVGNLGITMPPMAMGPR